LQWKKVTSGRVLSILTCLGEINYNFVNVYVPTNPSERKSFLNSIRDYFFPNSVKILAGDFNCTESEKDNFGGNFVSAKELKELRRNAHLVDIWRKIPVIAPSALGLMHLNPLVRDYPRFSPHCN